MRPPAELGGATGHQTLGVKLLGSNKGRHVAFVRTSAWYRAGRRFQGWRDGVKTHVPPYATSSYMASVQQASRGKTRYIAAQRLRSAVNTASAVKATA
jgi:hypothetical protein